MKVSNQGNIETIITDHMFQELCKEHKEWDDELNNIYGILKVQLSSSDMKKLQNEEIQWIKDRDAKVKKAPPILD